MADWKLEHEQDFTRAGALDADFWSVETGFFRNREDQYYTPANLAVVGGKLRIEARKEQVPNAAYRPDARGWRSEKRLAQYTSGSIASKRSFHYGRVEVVARSPSGAGVWPAIWLVHESEGQYGEIDIFEAVGKHPDTAFAGVHYGRDPLTRQHRSAHRVVPGFEGSWRVHTVEWTPQRIVVFLDGRPLLAFDPAEAERNGADPLRRPMRLRINLALGGSWGGPIDDRLLPARFDIASVRIWSWAPGSGAPVAAPRLPADEPAAPAPRWGR
ncbi:MAG TPA: glycoside hydrolase family 16 protein [Ramlibacter sp.]|nr:glycoside hydrolase family 16 protein [Ramlibacter sp.]